MTSEFRVPAPLQNTIDNLAFLASTDDGEKLFFKERLHINKTDWTARMRRYYYNETLESQKKIIKEIIDLGLDSLKSYKENVHYGRLVTEFGKAKDGLCNLRNTYLKEGREIQDLDNYIYVMENQITALKKPEKKIIVMEQPRESAPVPINTSQHYHFDTNDNYEDEDEDEDTSQNTSQNTSHPEKNHYVIDMNPINAKQPLVNTPPVNNNNESRGKTRLKAKTIAINNRPELEQYMNRSKQH